MAFWSTTSGVVTGVAGTLTGVVGIATLAAQMGWIGSDGEAREEPSSTTTRAGAEATGTGSRPGEAGTRVEEDRPAFAVAPGALRFEALGSRSATLTVRNTGDAEVSVEEVTVEGDDDDRFTVAATPCTASTLDPGRSCEVDVLYSPGGGTAKATLVVEVDGAPAQEVPLTAAGLL